MHTCMYENLVRLGSNLRRWWCHTLYFRVKWKSRERNNDNNENNENNEQN